MGRTNIRAHSPEWYSARERLITASTCAAVLGESKWSSPLVEWARLTGKLAKKQTESGYADFGLATEEAHLLWIAQDHRATVEPGRELWVHDEIPWLGATPDGFEIEGPWPEALLLELKAPSPWTADEWGEALPVPYVIQVQVGLLVTGLKGGFMSVLIPPKKDTTGALMGLVADLERGESLVGAMPKRGWERWEYYQEADSRFQDALVRRLSKWWAEHVETGIAPTAGALGCDKAALEELNAGKEADLDFDEAAAGEVEALEDLQAQIKALETDAEKMKNALTQKAGVATWGEAKKAIKQARKAVGL